MRKAAVAAAVVLGLALSGCAAESAPSPGDTETNGTAKLEKVKVGVIPIIANAIIPMAIDQGFFKDEGLDVEVVISSTTAQPAAVLSDEFQIMNSTYGNLATYIDSGIPLVSIAPNNIAGNTLEDDYSHIVVSKDSQFNSVKDLKGKTIAVNSLGSFAEVSLLTSLKAAGLDPKDVKLIPIPYQDQMVALSSGRVDAAGAAEPFIAQAGDAVRSLYTVDASIAPDLPLGDWLAAKKWVDERPDLVRKFQLGMEKAIEFAREHEGVVREYTASFSKLDPDVAKNVILPIYSTSMDIKAIEALRDAYFEYGIIDKKVNIADSITDFPLPAKK